MALVHIVNYDNRPHIIHSDTPNFASNWVRLPSCGNEIITASPKSTILIIGVGSVTLRAKETVVFIQNESLTIETVH